MSIKLSSTSADPTQIILPGSEHTVLPNADWTLGIAIVWDGNTTSSDNSQPLSNGQTTGCFSMVARPTGRILHCFINGGTTGRAAQANESAMVPGNAYLLIAERRNGVLRTKQCPILSLNPNDGSAVLTSPNTYALTVELPGGGDMRIGARPPGDRRWDNSSARAFFMHGVLTDLEIAKLAYGMDIYEIGKTPKWYVRMNNGNDTADFGPNSLVTSKTGILETGTPIPFGYVSVNSPPTVTKPSIQGSPQVGTLVTALSGTVGGYPNPVSTWEWLRNGALITTTSTPEYVPVAADVGTGTLSVRQVVTSGQGMANATSDPVSVAASANAIYVAPPVAERIFQRINGVAAVPFALTYTGDQPASIEYQLYDPDGVTVRKAWSSMGATIAAGGSATAAPGIPQGAKKYRIAVRTKTAGGAVIATSAVHTDRFGVGDLILLVGSSTAQTWARKSTGNADNDIYSSFNTDGWGIRPEQTLASKMAARITAASGVVVGMVTYGASGTSLTGSQGWLNKTYLHWTRLTDGLNAIGNKIAGAAVAIGSNDAGGITVESKALWKTQIETFVQNLRDLSGVPNLRILWSGLNLRTTGAMATNPDAFDKNCDYIRMAELDMMLTDPNFVVSPSLQFQIVDGVHLTDADYDKQTDLMPYVWNEFVAGRTPRGPRITSLTYQGNRIRVGFVHGNGSDLTPFVDPTGFAAYAADGSALTFAVEKFRSTAIDLVCSGNVARATYMAGRNPDNTRTIYDNGTTALPMFPEMDRVAVAGDLGSAPAPDTTAPVMTGSITVASVTTSGATISCSAATDGVGIVGYEYSINGGTSYTLIANGARSVVITGRPEGTEHQVRMRALDAAGNRATPLSATFTTAVTPPVVTPPAQGGVLASTVAESRRIAFPGGTRVVRFGTQPSSVTPNAPYLQAGKWWATKHPLDERYWVADITIDLAERGTTAMSVEPIVAGVTVLQQPVIQGKLIPVKLGGFNATTNAANFCTFRVTCANGERFDRTIWFKQQAGLYSLSKDADDQSYYVGDIGNDLVDSNTTASAVLALPVGVEVLVPAVIQGSLILVKLGGMDTLPAGVNYCDLRIDCANSERFYRTIQFNRVDN
jgi:hypothetical protein